MGLIAKEHAEWAVVDRLRQMLEVPQGEFKATQSFALFSSILCWVMQHIRIKHGQQVTDGDKAAAVLYEELDKELIASEPWNVRTDPAGRIEPVGSRGVAIPAPQGFEEHTAARFLKNLRDAMAHGDARTVEPFNDGDWLVGFTFNCSEHPRGELVWEGKITLIRSDFQRLGSLLATRYCDAMKASGIRQYGGHFEGVAASFVEDAA
jgi:hypothetical protein